MKILNIGSLNIDYVYQVSHHVASKETLSSLGLDIFAGGKGLNQSIAVAKAGGTIFHAGMVGEDGQFLIDALKTSNVDTRYVQITEGKSGHAIIQLNQDKENCILLYAGSNRKLTEVYVDEVLNHFEEGDILILQNEVNLLKEIINKAYGKKMTIVLNPSPYDEKIELCELSKVDYFLLNEIEGQQMSQCKDEKKMLDQLIKMYPNAKFVLTLGEKGAIYAYKDHRVYQEIVKVEVVDTTAAGDTFTGYFIAGVIEGLPIEKNLARCAHASALCVSKQGAAPSIPFINEIND